MNSNQGKVFILSLLLLFICFGATYISGEEYKLKLESIYFNHIGKDNVPNPAPIINCVNSTTYTDALDLRKNRKDEVGIPEWGLNAEEKIREDPAVYSIRQENISIIATFKNIGDEIPKDKTIWIGADDKSDSNGKASFGNIKAGKIPLADGLEVGKKISVSFCLSNPSPDKITAFTQKWYWYWMEDSNSSGKNDIVIPKDNKLSENRIYVILNDEASSPWADQGINQRWAEALEIACCWAKGKKETMEVVQEITEKLYNDSGGIFTRKPHYSRPRRNRFHLSKFINALKQPEKECPFSGKIQYVNCFDMAKALVTFANVLGCNTEYGEVRGYLKLNHVRPIGEERPSYSPKFTAHAIALIGDFIFDPTLKICDGNRADEKCRFIHRDQDQEPIRVTWDDYKNTVFEKYENLYFHHPYEFEIGEIIQRESCAFQEKTRKAKRMTNFKNWHTDTDKIVCLKKTQDVKKNTIDKESTLQDKVFDFITNTQSMSCQNDNIFNYPLWDRKKLAYKEKILDISSGTYIKYNIKRQAYSFANTKTNSGNSSHFSVEIIEGKSMKEIKKYLLYRYASWSNWPISVTKLKNIGQIGILIKEKKGQSSFHIDFIRDNILIMLQEDGFSKEKLIDFAKGLDKYIQNKKEFKRIKIKQSSYIVKKSKELLIETRFKRPGLYKGRRTVIQVWSSSNKGAFFLKAKPGERSVKVPFMKKDKIRIFPGFVNHCTPTGYYVEYPDSWSYKHAIPSSKFPSKNLTDKEKSESYRLIFYAPSDFPEPEGPVKGKGPNTHRIYIWGDPPIWWVEIIPPESEKYFLDVVSGNVKVGEDDQDD